MSAIILASALFFVAVALAVAVSIDVVLSNRQVFRTMRAIDTIELKPGVFSHRELAVPFYRRVAFPAVRRLGSVGRRFTPASVVERLEKELVYAGSPRAWDAERFLALKVFAAGAIPLGVFIVAKLTGVATPRALVAAAPLAFLSYYTPEWILRSRSHARQFAIQRALPDALDLLSITVEAGLAFDAAVGRVARQAGGPLGEELHRVLQEMQLGKSRSEALHDLGERTTVEELRGFVLAMIQADVFGISIAGVLHTQAREMRIKRRQRAEERAQKLQVKIVFPLILCIFPSLFVVLLGPAVLTIYRTLLNGT